MASHDNGALMPTSFDARPSAPILFHPNLLRSWGNSNGTLDCANHDSSATRLPLSKEVTPSESPPPATMSPHVAATNIEVPQLSSGDPACGRNGDITSAGVNSDQTEQVADGTSDITSNDTSGRYQIPLPRNETDSNIIVIQEGGDLTLTIGADIDKSSFLVSRNTLELKCPTIIQRASAVDGRQVRIFDGYDWDLSPMRIVLDIAHANLNRLPRWTPLVTLARLAYLGEACDLVELLLPFVSQRLHSLAHHQAHSTHLSWLHIAWTFGFRELFHAQLKYHIEHVTWYDHQLSIREPGDVKTFLASTHEDSLYGL
jgi:hypothetical protein